MADRYVHGQGILFEVGPSFIRHFGAAYKERRQQQITGRPLKSRVKDPLHNETSAVSAQRPIWSACDMQMLPALLFWSFLKKLKCVGTCLGAQVNFWKKIVLLRKHLLFDLCYNLKMSCSKPRTDFMPLADYILRTLYLACYEFFRLFLHLPSCSARMALSIQMCRHQNNNQTIRAACSLLCQLV